MAKDFENEELENEMEDSYEEEEYESEEEVYEGSDETDESEEEYEAESEEEETEVDEEDPEIPIVYYDDEGKRKSFQMKYSQIGELYKDYEKAHEIINQYNTYYSQTLPIINAVKDSQLLQTILYYKGQGYSDAQIQEWLKQVETNTNQSSEPANFEEEIANIVARELDKRIKPLEQQTQTMQTTAYLEEVSKHNNKLLHEALQEAGLKSVEQTDLKRLGEFLADMYPGVDLRFLKLTKSSARALIQLLRHEKMKQSKSTKAPSVVKKIAKLPKLIGGNNAKPSSSTSKGTKLDVDKPLKLEDRIRLKQSLWR